MNPGLQEAASGHEIAAYFDAIMREDFLPSGRVSYHPMTEYVGDGTVVSLLSGKRYRIDAATLVDATLIDTSIPLTHQRSFEVAAEAACIPPNDLPRLAPGFSHFTVIGGGKTAFDSVLFLLDNDADPDSITWIMPRDAWMVNRASIQSGSEFYNQLTGFVASQQEACAAATSLEDLFERLEAGGNWFRLDPSVRPTMFHAATVTESELLQVRRVQNVIRRHRVERIEADRLVLTGTERPAKAGTLYVDCAARALAKAITHTTVFDTDRINIQMIRQFQPCFSGALIGRMEATIDDLAEKQGLSKVAPMTDTPQDWVRSLLPGLDNERAWIKHPEIRGWVTKSRLNFLAALQNAPPPDANAETRDRIRQSSASSYENLLRLASS